MSHHKVSLNLMMNEYLEKYLARANNNNSIHWPLIDGYISTWQAKIWPWPLSHNIRFCLDLLTSASCQNHGLGLETRILASVSALVSRPHLVLVWTVWSYLKGNSTLKNILPKINIYDKWSYVSVIKLKMQIRYRRIMTIKLLILRNVFLHRGRSSKPSSLFLYLCLFVDGDMVTKKLLFICSFVRKSMRCFHCLAGNSAIIRSTSPTLFDM